MLQKQKVHGYLLPTTDVIHHFGTMHWI